MRTPGTVTPVVWVSSLYMGVVIHACMNLVPTLAKQYRDQFDMLPCCRDAYEAARARDGYDFYGARLRVELAKGSQPGGGGGFGGGGFGGGFGGGYGGPPAPYGGG